MNDISRDEGLPRGPSGLDPDLIRLFDAAPPVAEHDELFVATLLARVQRARRARLLARAASTLVIVVLGGLLAPYVAQATLTVMGSMVLYPVGCVCAALVAWRTARQRFN